MRPRKILANRGTNYASDNENKQKNANDGITLHFKELNVQKSLMIINTQLHFSLKTLDNG